mgnify:CR=1 FL=1
MNTYFPLLFLSIAIGFLIYLQRKHETPNKVIVPLLCLILGIFVSLLSYENLTSFNEDLRSEIIGMLIEIGVIYLLIDWSLQVDRKRERESKERTEYIFYMRSHLKNLLYKLEKRYLSLFDEKSDNRLTKRFLDDHFYEKVKLEVFTGNSDTQSYNHLFRNFAIKEVEKFILIYRHTMPTTLLHYLLCLEGELQKELETDKINTNMLNKNNPDLVEFYILSSLKEIGYMIVEIYNYATEMEKKYFGGQAKYLKNQDRKIIREEKIAKLKKKAKQFFKFSKPLGKDKDNDTSTSV